MDYNYKECFFPPPLSLNPVIFGMPKCLEMLLINIKTLIIRLEFTECHFFFPLKSIEDTRTPAAKLTCLSFNYLTKDAVQASDSSLRCGSELQRLLLSPSILSVKDIQWSIVLFISLHLPANIKQTKKKKKCLWRPGIII